jgi:hypothetical protein
MSTLDDVSLCADYHFIKRFGVYAGIAYSDVSGGLAIVIPHGPLACEWPHFRDYHLLLDEQADQIFGMTDAIAEGVRTAAGVQCDQLNAAWTHPM